MLIKNGNLDSAAFKDFFEKLEWKKVPRVLSKKIKEHFFIGFYEDDKMKVEISVRPSKRMQVKESFKNRLKNGNEPKNPEDPNAIYTFGTSVEILVEDSFIKHLQKIAKTPEIIKIQKLDWS